LFRAQLVFVTLNVAAGGVVPLDMINVVSNLQLDPFLIATLYVAAVSPLNIPEGTKVAPPLILNWYTGNVFLVYNLMKPLF
jgi:hypothetical protein